MSKLEKQSMLVLATQHLTRETARLLEQDEDDCPIGGVMRWLYGWLVWVDVEMDYLDEPLADLAACMALARDNGCQWVRFDCDVEPIEQLKLYEWPVEDEWEEPVARPAAKYRVLLRAPRAGERGWQVKNWHDADEALAECRREGAFVDDDDEPGWPAEAFPVPLVFEDDSEGMRPITIEVVS